MGVAKEEILESIGQLTVPELVELTDAFKEKFMTPTESQTIPTPVVNEQVS